MAYTYKDLMTGQVRRTRGTFYGWSDPTGPLNVRYAIFECQASFLNVPSYCLTRETLDRLPPPGDPATKSGEKESDDCVGDP